MDPHFNDVNSPFLARTLQEVKEMSKKSKDNYGCYKEPLLNIELDHIIVDELHLLLRITNVLTANIKHRHAKHARVIFLVIGSRIIRRTVHSNDLVKFLGGLRCTARRKLEIYNLQIQRYTYIGNGKIAK